jgi:hypothetical protein
MLKYLVLAVGLISAAHAQSPSGATPHRALDLYAVTVGGTAVTAMTGPANGCLINGNTIALTINRTGPAATTVTTSSISVPVGSTYNCGQVAINEAVSINCVGGVTCSWAGDRW